MWTQRYHSHDVRSIVITDEFVISGGIHLYCNDLHKGMDTLVVICDHEGRFIQRKTGFPQRPVISLSEERRMISAQFSHSIQLWKIGTSTY